MSANIYQGEITLIKIDDGVNAPVITKIYDFYYLSNSAEPPQVLSEDRSVEEIKNSGWFEKTDEGKNTNINNDTTMEEENVESPQEIKNEVVENNTNSTQDNSISNNTTKLNEINNEVSINNTISENTTIENN